MPSVLALAESALCGAEQSACPDDARDPAPRMVATRRWTIGRKLMAIVAACIGCGYVILIAVQVQQFHAQSYSLAFNRALNLTKLIAVQVTGGIRWGKPAAIERAYSALTLDPASTLASVVAFDRLGDAMTTYQSDHLAAFDLTAAFALTQGSLRQGRIHISEHEKHIVMMAPIFAGKDRTRVGTLAVAWSLEPLHERVASLLLRQVLLSILIVLCMIAVLIWLLHRVVSCPLVAVTRTTQCLARGETSCVVPMVDRNDEIGDMSRSLEVFKKNLITIDRLNAEQQAQTRRLSEALEKERSYNVLQREFVAMASHEFRTPLTIIDSAAQRLQRQLTRLGHDDAKERTTKIRTAVKRMISLIESVLSAASLDAGKFKLEVQECDLKEVLEKVCRRQREISTTHSIRTEIAALPELIVGDPRLLEQTFSNLLSNAIKFSPEESEVIVVGLERGGSAMVVVKDHGVGIPEDEIPKVFDRFYRASTASGIAGTGIGLNLVQQVVELHGGSVELESKAGEGTSFIVRLPLRELLVAPDELAACAPDPPSGSSPSLPEEVLAREEWT